MPRPVDLLPWPAGRIVRELHDYPDRASPSYADLDRRMWTARLGVAGDAHGVARVGMTVDGPPDTLGFHVATRGHRSPGDTLVGVRLDTQGRDGRYGRSVLFHTWPAQVPPRARTDAPPWGTGRPADRVEVLPYLGEGPIPVRAMAPPGWTGRVQVGFVLADAGPDGRATFRLTRR